MAPPALNDLAALAGTAKSWPFEQGRALLRRVIAGRLDGEGRALAEARLAEGRLGDALGELEALRAPVVLETGYGPSGLPHLGTFQEVARTTMVRTAFRALTGDAIPTRLICFSDDMDGLRKVAPNLPDQAGLAADLGKPLTKVRDPFGEHESFGAHNNARLRAFLDTFGFDYEFVSSTECYTTGRFDEVLLRALERFDAIQAIMLPTLGEERRATYSPFLPISPSTGRVLQTPTLERDPASGVIVFRDEDGTLVEQKVTGGLAKLQWKPDWAMRWTALGVDYEMSGKDLIDSVKVSTRICRVLGGAPPEGFTYELFLDETGQKISKTKGNGLTMEDWLRYGAAESLSYYVFQNPKSAKKLYFDVIPKASDEYLQQLEALNRVGGPGAASPNPLDNPVWHVHAGAPPARAPKVTFGLLLNLVSASGASDKETLWGFISRYDPTATPKSEPLLDRLAVYAINYYEDFVLPTKAYRRPTDVEKAAMSALLERLDALPADCADGELIQGEVYAVGKEAGFEPLRTWFQALYEVLLGQSQGPRFGSFAAIFGLERTRALLRAGITGALAPAEAAIAPQALPD
jgi:lysyl-tRNA synthetase class 1